MILLMVKEEYCTDNWNNRADSTHKTISTLFVGLGDSRVERHGGNIYFRVSSTSVADPEPDSDLFPDPDKMDPIRPGNSSSFHISKQNKKHLEVLKLGFTLCRMERFLAIFAREN